MSDICGKSMLQGGGGRFMNSPEMNRNIPEMTINGQKKMKNQKTKKKRKKIDFMDIFSFAFLTFWVILILVPFWNALVISFETAGAYASQRFSWLPTEFTLENYKYLINTGTNLGNAYRTTIITTLIGTVTGMAIMTMAAYVFSRQFPGKKLLFRLTIFTMFFGGGLVPTYLLVKNLKLIDTYAIIILMELVSVYSVIIMKNGYEIIPEEIQDAGRIDGANDLQIFFRVMLPLQKPMIATFSLFQAVAYWNSWYWPMIFINSGKKNTLQLFLRSIVNASEKAEYGASSKALNMFSQGIKMASVFAVMVPIMVVYPFLQKYFVKGITVGAIKS